MTDGDTLIDLYRHMEWADAAVWRAVPDPDSTTPDKNLHERLFHVHFTQQAFLGVWRGDEFDRQKSDAYATASEIKAVAVTFYPAARKLLSGITSSELSRPMPVPWAKFFARQLGADPQVTTFGETLLQVALHTQYHRGQINARLREIGAEPPMVDYIGWVWANRPDPKW